ncbi:hypothetical protein BGX27_002934, partial [Mortierella sp. AM989]
MTSRRFPNPTPLVNDPNNQTNPTPLGYTTISFTDYRDDAADPSSDPSSTSFNGQARDSEAQGTGNNSSDSQ